MRPPPLLLSSPLAITMALAASLLTSTPSWAATDIHSSPPNAVDSVNPTGAIDKTESTNAPDSFDAAGATDGSDSADSSASVDAVVRDRADASLSTREEHPAPSHRRHELTLAATQFSYFAFFRGTPTHTAVDVAISRIFHPFSGKAADGTSLQNGLPLLLGGGLRWSPGPSRGLPFELYATLKLRARLGPWEPEAGPELGYSGFTSLVSDREYRPPDLFDLEQQRVSPVYLQFGMAPLRFVVHRFTISAAELQVGATLSPPGGARRFQLGLLRLGWRL